MAIETTTIARDPVEPAALVFDWLDVQYAKERNGDVALTVRLIPRESPQKDLERGVSRKGVTHSVFIPRGSKPAGVAISLRNLADLIDDRRL